MTDRFDLAIDSISSDNKDNTNVLNPSLGSQDKSNKKDLFDLAIDKSLEDYKESRKNDFLKGTNELDEETSRLIKLDAQKKDVEGKINLLAKYDKLPDEIAKDAKIARRLGLKPSDLVNLTPETQKEVKEAFNRSNIKIDTSLDTPAVYGLLDDAQTAKIAQDSFVELQGIERELRINYADKVRLIERVNEKLNEIRKREVYEKNTQSKNPINAIRYGSAQMIALTYGLYSLGYDALDNTFSFLDNDYISRDARRRLKEQRDSFQVKLSNTIEKIPHDLRIGKIVEEYDKKGLWSSLGYAVTNPTIATSVLSQALPSILSGGAVGGVAKKAIAKGIENRIASQTLKNYMYKTASLGTIGAVSTAGMSYQPNLNQGYEKTGIASEAVSRARTQTAVDSAFGFAGGSIPFFSKGASRIGRVLNVSTEATAQSVAGGAGAYYSAKAVGDEITGGEIFVNAFMGFITAPVDMVVAGVSGGKRFDVAVREDLTTASKVIKEVKSMALTERDPETAKEAIRKIKDSSESHIQDVYINADEFVRYFQEQEIDPVEFADQVTGVKGSLDEALATGTDLKIPLENYAVDIAAKGHDTVFAENLRTAPDAMNGKELAEFDNHLVENNEEFVKKINDTIQENNKSFQDKRVYNDVYGQLIGIDTDKATAEKQASIYGAFFNTLGDRLGVDPVELYSKYNLAIKRELPDVLTNPSKLDSLDILINRLRNNEVPTDAEAKGKSLFQRINELGGIKDDGGELASRDLGKGRRGKDRIINNKSGKSLDDIATELAREGYLNNLSDVAEMDKKYRGTDLVNILIDSMDKEARGDLQYSPLRMNDDLFSLKKQLNEIQDLIDHQDIDLNKLTNKEIKDLLVGGNRYNQDQIFKPVKQEAESYRTQLEKANSSLVSRNIEIELGNTPLALRAVGAPDLKVKITRDTVRKATNKVKHDVSMDAIKSLPELLNDPIAIFKSSTENDALVVLVDAFDESNRPVIAAVHLNFKEGRGALVNKIASVYGKDNIKNFINKGIDNNNLLYRRNEKSLNSVRSDGLQLPMDGSPSKGLVNNVLNADDVVNLFQQQKDQVNGFISLLKDGSVRINLTENANLSTFLHESGHFFLNVLGDAEQIAKSDNAIHNDIAALKKWLKADDFKNLTVEQHEQFARGFEAYLFEGKAPSIELRGAFARFKVWLTQVYKVIRNLNVNLNDDVRRVFDRMLATDDAIEIANTPYKETFTTAEQMGVSEREFNLYKDEAVKATEQAKEKLLADSLKEITRETRQWWKDERAKVKEQVTNEVNSQPVYRVQDYLKKGLQTDGTSGEPVKLNRDILIERYGKGIVRELKGLTDKDGVNPESVSMMWGFSSSDEMVKALRSARDRNALVNAETDARMRETYGDILNDGSISDRAIAAVENDGRSKLLEVEQKAINNQLRKSDKAMNARDAENRAARNEAYSSILPSETLKEYAVSAISQKKITDINPHLYRNAEIKASRDAFNAASKKDWQLAASKKEQERFNHFLYREALRAKEEETKIFKYLNSFNKTSVREKIGKAEGGHLEQIDALLAQYEIKKVSNRQLERRKSLSDYVNEQQALGNVVAIPKELIESANQVNYKQLTFEELQGLRDAVKNIDKLATLKRKLISARGELDYEATKQELIDQLSSTIKSEARQKPLSTSSRTVKDSVIQGAIEFDSSLIRMEHLINLLDGDNKEGIFHKVFFNPLADAVANEKAMFKADMLDLMKQADKLTGLNDNHYIASIGRSFSTRELMMIALNAGNESNKSRLLSGGIDGLKLTEAHLSDLLAPLTKDKWDFVQSVWNSFENRWNDISAMYKRLSGVEPPKVDIAPINTAHGEYKGGYFPIIYDRSKPNAPDAFIGGELFNGDFEGAFPSNGFINARNDNVTGPLKLEISAISQHMMMQIHDLTHREALQNAYRLAKDRDIRNALINKLGSEQADLFINWLKNIANSSNPSGGNSIFSWGGLFNTIKNNTSVVGLGFSTTTMLAQTCGVVPVIRYTGIKDFAIGMTNVLKNPLEMPNFIMEKSPAMKMRWDTTQSRIEASYDRLKGKNEFFRQKERVVRFAFDLLNIIDRYVSGAGWLGAYERAIKEGKSESLAIREGDAVVRMSQGGFEAMDKASLQFSDNKVMQMFTLFYTPFGAFYNQVRDLSVEVKNGITSKPKAAAVILATAFFQGVMGDLITGQGPDDDENTLLWMMKSTIGFGVSGVPILRDTLGSQLSGRTYSMSPLGQTIDKVFRLPENLGKGKVKQSVEGAGLLLGVPVKPLTRQGDAIYQMTAGEYSPDDATGFVKALIYGVRKKDKK